MPTTGEFDPGSGHCADWRGRQQVEQMLMNVAQFGRKNVPLVASQLNIRRCLTSMPTFRAGTSPPRVEIDKCWTRSRHRQRHAPVSITHQRAGRKPWREFGGLSRAWRMAGDPGSTSRSSSTSRVGGSIGRARSCPVHARRRDVDAVLTQTHLSTGLMGSLMVYRPHLANSISCGDVRQSAHGGGRRQGLRRDRCGFIPEVAAGIDDRGRHDLGMIRWPWGGRGRRTECAFGRASLAGFVCHPAATMIFVPVVIRMLRRDLSLG